MPDRETIEAYAATGATMAVFLSVVHVDELTRRLLAHGDGLRPRHPGRDRPPGHLARAAGRGHDDRADGRRRAGDGHRQHDRAARRAGPRRCRRRGAATSTTLATPRGSGGCRGGRRPCLSRATRSCSSGASAARSSGRRPATRSSGADVLVGSPRHLAWFGPPSRRAMAGPTSPRATPARHASTSSWSVLSPTSSRSSAAGDAGSPRLRPGLGRPGLLRPGEDPGRRAGPRRRADPPGAVVGGPRLGRGRAELGRRRGRLGPRPAPGRRGRPSSCGRRRWRC